MGLLGSIAGSAINSAFGALDASTQYHYQSKLAKYVNSNKHQWEVNDLRKAGLNPILSATGGMGYANAGGISVNSDDNGLGSAETNSNTALKMNKETLANQKDIAEMQNKTQKEFNDEANRIALKNAMSNEMNAISNTAFQKANTEAMLASIIRSDKVAEAEIAMKNAIGQGALMQGSASLSQANTALSHYESKKGIYDLDYKIREKQLCKLGSDPHTGEHGNKLGWFDYAVDNFAKIMAATRGGGSSAYTFNNYGEYYK